MLNEEKKERKKKERKKERKTERKKERQKKGWGLGGEVRFSFVSKLEVLLRF